MKFKAWCQAKGTVEKKAMLGRAWVVAKKIAEKVVALTQQQERKRLG